MIDTRPDKHFFARTFGSLALSRTRTVLTPVPLVGGGTESYPSIHFFFTLPCMFPERAAAAARKYRGGRGNKGMENHVGDALLFHRRTAELWQDSDVEKSPPPPLNIVVMLSE